MKHIVVKFCGTCPNCMISFIEGMKKVVYCRQKHTGNGYRCVEDSAIIPDWCPLEDYEEDN